MVPGYILRSDAEDLAGCLALIKSSLLQRPIELDGTGAEIWALVHTAAAIPAFLRM